MGADDRPATTLHHYLRVLRRRKWIVVACVVVAPLVALVFAPGGAAVYTSSAQVLFSRQDLSAGVTGVNDPTQIDPVRLLATQAQLARLPTIAEQAVSASGVKNVSADDLLNESSVTPSTTSDFLTFTVSDSRPSRATRLATAYADQYVAYDRQYQATQLAAAGEAVQARISQVKASGGAGSQLYGRLLNTASQLAAMQALAGSTGDIVAGSAAGRAPSTVSRDVLLALALGLITGVGLAFLRDSLDTRIRSADEMSGSLGLRLLARLPQPPRQLRRGAQLVMLADPEGPHAEPFRMLRTSLEFGVGRGKAGRRRVGKPLPTSEKARHCYRMMVTSAIEGEGKSTTAANLAVAFARSGRNVALVDLDFRRASLHKFFGLDNRTGLSDLVLGSSPVDAIWSEIAIVPDMPAESSTGGLPVGTLRVVPFGPSPPHALDTSFVVGLERALSQLDAATDLLLIDSPPMLRVGDTLELTSYADGLLVVASLRTIRAPMVKELRRVLDDSDVAKLGFVLTGADREGGYEYLSRRYPHRALTAG